MNISLTQLERKLFRRINSLVEPLVSRGLGSSRVTPASLIVLESTGFKSGQPRRTPLWSVGLGSYRLVSTARGNRSFWVKNLQKDAQVNFSLNGKVVDSDALVLAPGFDNLDDWELSPLLTRLFSLLRPQVKRGWAFALLVPSEG